MNFDTPTDSSLPPMPNNPDHPQTPPPNIPIPGEPTGQGEMHRHQYKCKKCGKIFNSKQELRVHTEKEHAKSKMRK